jgi:hypothetical protein
MRARSAFLGCCALAACGGVVEAQEKAKEKAIPPIFQSETPFAVTFTANLKRLRADKKDGAPWRDASVTYTDSAGAKVVVPIKARTRGIWRLNNCEFPPLRLDFAKDSVKSTPFAKLDKPKLVSYCRNSPRFEQYVLQELQLYRIYQLLTPMSHRARLLRVAYADSARGEVLTTKYAILLEEPDEMAERIGGKMLEQQGAGPADVDTLAEAVFSVFQYMVANTDFSLVMLHNVELVIRQADGQVIPVAYDFDFAGAINAPYATTDPRLSIRHVRQRLFRGFCAPPETFERVFALFREKKDAIYALYSDEVGNLLDRTIAREALEYFDAFYKTINDPKQAKREIVESCRRD